MNVLGAWDFFRDGGEEPLTAEIDNEIFISRFQSAIERDDVEAVSTFLEDARAGGVRFSNKGAAKTPLHLAVEERSNQVLRVLLDSDYEFNIADAYGDLPIHCCTDKCYTETLRILLEHKVSTSEINGKGNTIWHLVVASKDTSLLQELHLYASDQRLALSQVSKMGRTPLAEAVAIKATGTALLLLSFCPAEIQYFKSDIPILHQAVVSGSLRLVLQLREIMPSIEEFDSEGRTPLFYMNPATNMDLFTVLLRDYDPQKADTDGKSAFQSFVSILSGQRVSNNSLALFEAFLSHSHVYPTPSGIQHVWEICCGEFFTRSEQDRKRYQERRDWKRQLYESILEAGVLESFEKLRQCSVMMPVFDAIRSSPRYIKDAFLVEFLERMSQQEELRYQVVPEAEGQSLLRYACLHDAGELATFLVENGISVHTIYRGYSALEYACRKCSPYAMRNLLRYTDASRIDEINDDGLALVHVALEGSQSARSKRAKLELLLEKQANCNVKAQNRWAFTPILLAANNGHFEIVNLIVRHGGSLSDVANNNYSVAAAAASRGEFDIIRRIHQQSEQAGYDWNRVAVLGILGLREGHQHFERMQDCHLLHAAAFQGHENIVRYLFDRNLVTRADFQTNLGTTPLHLASSRGYIGIIKCLLKCGADSSIVNCNGKDARACALENRHTQAAAILSAWAKRSVQVTRDATESSPKSEEQADASHVDRSLIPAITDNVSAQPTPLKVPATTDTTPVTA